MNGSLLIAEASSIEEVKGIVERDTYYINDIVSLLASSFHQSAPLTHGDSGTRRRLLLHL